MSNGQSYSVYIQHYNSENIMIEEREVLICENEDEQEVISKNLMYTSHMDFYIGDKIEIKSTSYFT